jgi:hypothetical protein
VGVSKAMQQSAAAVTGDIAEIEIAGVGRD